MNSFEERLQSVERRQVHARWLVTAVVVGMVLMRLMIPQPERPDLLECRELVIVDGNGNPAARLSAGESGGRLDMINSETAESVAIFSVGEMTGTGSLTLLDEEGEGLIVMGTRPYEEPSSGMISIMSESMSVLELKAEEHGGAVLVLNRKPSRDEAIRLRVDESGNGVLDVLERGDIQ